MGFSNHGTQPASEASQGPGEGPPFPVAPVTAMGLLLSSLPILSLCGYVLFCHSGMSDSLRPWTAARQASLSHTISQSLLKLTSIELMMPSKPSHPLLSPSPPALNLSQHQRPKYRSFSFSISPSSEYSGLISFGIDWFDLAIQGTLKSPSAPQF